MRSDLPSGTQRSGFLRPRARCNGARWTSNRRLGRSSRDLSERAETNLGERAVHSDLPGNYRYRTFRFAEELSAKCHDLTMVECMAVGYLGAFFPKRARVEYGKSATTEVTFGSA